MSFVSLRRVAIFKPSTRPYAYLIGSFDQLINSSSPKEYKKHISRWDLDKKKKEPEMVAIVRKRKERLDVEKDSAFTIRGQPIEFEEVERYFKRKKIKLDSILRQRARTRTPPSIRYWTPEPVPVCLQLPDDLRHPEALYRTVQVYFKGCFDAGTWYDNNGWCKSMKSTNSSDSSILIRFFDGYYAAYSLLENGDFISSVRLMVSANTLLSNIVSAELPDTLEHFVRLILRAQYHEKPEIGAAFINQVVGITELKLGKDHPLHRICNQIAQFNLGTSHYQQHLMTLLEIMVNAFEEIIGPTAETVVTLRLRYLAECSLLLSTHDTISSIQVLVDKLDSMGRSRDLMSLEARSYLADALYHRSDYEGAKTAANDALVRAQSLPSTESSCWIQKECLAILFFVHWTSQELEQAEASIRGYIRIARQAGDEDGTDLLWGLNELERLLKRLGKYDDAAEIRREMDEMTAALEVYII